MMLRNNASVRDGIGCLVGLAKGIVQLEQKFRE
jgi:hypothetical protein